MSEFFPEIAISAPQAEAIARGLYAIASTDGVHERELALISEVYQEAVGENSSASKAALANLDRAGALSPTELATVLPSTEQRMLFVKSSLLLAWADGKVSPGERATINEYAKALAVAPDAVARLEAEVKDFLLAPLATLANVEAAAAVAKKLGA